MKNLFSSISLLGCLAVTAAAADWRQFRGPQGNGFTDDGQLLNQFFGEQSVIWKCDLPGRGLSSPIIVGDRVFVTCSSGVRQDRLHVLCFNAADGSKRWERQFWATGRTMCHEKTSVAAPSPTSDGERIFAIFSSNDLVCLDLDGNLLWLRGLTRDYPNASNSLGMSSSLVVADGILVAQVENDSESFSVGVDVKSGTNRWKMDRPKTANWTSPILIPSEGRTLVGLQSSKGLAAVEPATGRVVWNYAEGASTIPSSAMSDGVIYVPSFGLTALKPSTGEAAPVQLWRSNQLKPATSSPLVFHGRIYALNDAGVLTCGDAESGKRLWQLRLKGPFSATPVAAGVHLYAVNEKGVAQIVDTSKSEGVVVGELDLGQEVLATPAIAGGALYVRSNGRIWKLGKS